MCAGEWIVSEGGEAELFLQSSAVWTEEGKVNKRDGPAVDELHDC